MLKENNDLKSIEGLKQGLVRSFDEIFKKYNKKVYWFAYSYLKNKEETEDVVQEVFMNLWRFRDQISEQYEFQKYLFRITYNATCKKFRKKSATQKQLEQVTALIDLENNSTNIDSEFNSLYDYTIGIINKLPARQKEVILLNIEQQLDPEEISKKLNISKKTVENYLATAKGQVKNVLQKEGMLSFLFLCLFI